jgi:hypothetical protein
MSFDDVTTMSRIYTLYTDYLQINQQYESPFKLVPRDWLLSFHNNEHAALDPMVLKKIMRFTVKTKEAIPSFD